MPSTAHSQQALNQSMLEAVDFIHAEGWGAKPTLFGLVPTELIPAGLADGDPDKPLTLVVQDALPENIDAGSPELADYLSRIAWPEEVAGVVLAQEIRFRDTSSPDPAPRPARLFSGVLRSGGELTLLQNKPTEEELAGKGPFAEDDIELRGGPNVAPEVIRALRYGLQQDPRDVTPDD